jgi:hypothetical protein
MRLRNGKYECVLCGAQLNIPPLATPLVSIKTTSGSGAMRTIAYEGKDIHSCPLRRPTKLQSAR